MGFSQDQEKIMFISRSQVVLAKLLLWSITFNHLHEHKSKKCLNPRFVGGDAGHNIFNSRPGEMALWLRRSGFKYQHQHGGGPQFSTIPVPG